MLNVNINFYRKRFLFIGLNFFLRYLIEIETNNEKRPPTQKTKLSKIV